MLRAISQSVTVSVEQCPFVECLALTAVVTDRSEVVPEQFLDTHALSTKDWRKAQRDDPTLKCIIYQLESGSRVSVPQTQTNPIDGWLRMGLLPPPREFCRHILSCRELKAESFKRCLHSVLRGVSL